MILGRVAVMGLGMGPLNHFWYQFLDNVLPGRGPAIVVKKILADQIIAAPFFSLTYFMGKSKNMPDFLKKSKSKKLQELKELVLN